MLILPAYAKLNLALDVVARRDDGMHDIDSLIVRIDWHDIVGVSLSAASAPQVVMRVTGVAAEGVPIGRDNLAARAARLLLDHSGKKLHADIWLDKRVPHAAGLGGGSADAAATLQAVAVLLRRHGTVFDMETLQQAALELGSDVPVTFAVPGAHRVRGRGDALTPVRVAPLHLVVVVAGASSTALTFAALAPDEMSDGRRVDALVDRLRRAPDDAAPYGSGLERAACRANPKLAQAMAQVRALAPGRVWHMTGSGGALFTVVGDTGAAESLAALARGAGCTARACRTIEWRVPG